MTGLLQQQQQQQPSLLRLLLPLRSISRLVPVDNAIAFELLNLRYPVLLLPRTILTCKKNNQSTVDGAPIKTDAQLDTLTAGGAAETLAAAAEAPAAASITCTHVTTYACANYTNTASIESPHNSATFQAPSKSLAHLPAMEKHSPRNYAL